MAREIRKPKVVLEADIKEYDGPIEIDVTPREEEVVEEEVEEKVELVIPPGAAIPQASNSKLVSFNTWFQKKSSNNPKLKLSYKEAIEAHCKCIGVQAQATEEEYNAVLAHFGI